MRLTKRARPCRVCEHPERDLIDRALEGGQSPRSMARRYSQTTRKALTRHRDECLGRAEDAA